MKGTLLPPSPGRPQPGFVALALVLSACATPQGGDTDAERSIAEGSLAMTLEAQVTEAAAHFRLHATNTSDAPVVLEFRSGQRFDFVVQSADGSELWRWSQDRMFTQALGQETIPPRETVTYEGSWPAQGRTGTFEVVGRITADPPLEQMTTFVLPAPEG